jgi:hypothetical protein
LVLADRSINRFYAYCGFSRQRRFVSCAFKDPTCGNGIHVVVDGGANVV